MEYKVQSLFENIRHYANRVIEEKDKPRGYSMMEALCDIEKDWKTIERLMLTAK